MAAEIVGDTKSPWTLSPLQGLRKQADMYDQGPGTMRVWIGQALKSIYMYIHIFRPDRYRYDCSLDSESACGSAIIADSRTYLVSRSRSRSVLVLMADSHSETYLVSLIDLMVSRIDGLG